MTVAIFSRYGEIWQSWRPDEPDADAGALIQVELGVLKLVTSGPRFEARAHSSTALGLEAPPSRQRIA